MPTALAGVGAVLAVRDVRRGRRRVIYLPMLLLSAGMLAAFGLFSWAVPRWVALKASYCLSLSLPFALFLARGVEALRDKCKSLRRLTVGAELATQVGESTLASLAASGLEVKRLATAVEAEAEAAGDLLVLAPPREKEEKEVAADVESVMIDVEESGHSTSGSCCVLQ